VAIEEEDVGDWCRRVSFSWRCTVGAAVLNKSPCARLALRPASIGPCDLPVFSYLMVDRLLDYIV